MITKDYNQRKKNENEAQNDSYLETRSEAGVDKKVEQMPVDVENHAVHVQRNRKAGEMK